MQPIFGLHFQNLEFFFTPEPPPHQKIIFLQNQSYLKGNSLRLFFRSINTPQFYPAYMDALEFITQKDFKAFYPVFDAFPSPFNFFSWDLFFSIAAIRPKSFLYNIYPCMLSIQRLCTCLLHCEDHPPHNSRYFPDPAVLEQLLLVPDPMYPKQETVVKGAVHRFCMECFQVIRTNKYIFKSCVFSLFMFISLGIYWWAKKCCLLAPQGDIQGFQYVHFCLGTESDRGRDRERERGKRYMKREKKEHVMHDVQVYVRSNLVLLRRKMLSINNWKID